MGPLVPCELVTGGRFLREIPGGTSLHFGGSRPKMKYSRYYFEYHKAQGQPAGWEPQYRETGKGATPCLVPGYKGIKYQSSVFTCYAAWGRPVGCTHQYRGTGKSGTPCLVLSSIEVKKNQSSVFTHYAAWRRLVGWRHEYRETGKGAAPCLILSSVGVKLMLQNYKPRNSWLNLIRGTYPPAGGLGLQVS